MRRIKYGKIRKFDNKQRILTIGNFDGVHLGHQAILDYCVENAKKFSLKSSVLTFQPHPKEFFNVKPNQGCIQMLRDKSMEIFSRGIDEIIFARFDKKLANTTSHEFIRNVLVTNLNVRELVVGADFRFGKSRSGDAEMLIDQGTRLGFATTIVPEITIENMKISSSVLRNLAKNGNFASVQNLRCATLKFTGHVSHGNKLGRTLNYPTVNINVPDNLCFSGIFIVRITDNSPKKSFDRKWGIASIGTRPVLETDNKKLLEVYVLDWSGDIYSHLVTVEIMEKIRDEENFKSLDDLKFKMGEDEQVARKYIDNYNE
tara:strand:- start:7595 stop:8542 length:948 start_codon:yes stop_codon:yes gene_type:complete